MPFTVNDSVSPSNTPQTIIGAINALAYQVKSISGGATWKSTPPTTIQALSSSVGSQNGVFQSVGTVGQLNDIVQLKNGFSTLKIQAQRSNQQTDLYYLNWFPDTSLNPALTPGGLYFGYEQGGARLALNNSDLVLNRNNQFIGGISIINGNQMIFYIPSIEGLRLRTAGYSGHSIAISPYNGIKIYGFNGAAILFDIAENSGANLRNYNASFSCLTIHAASGQAVDLLQFKNISGVAKLGISNDFKINFPENSNSPTNASAPVGWVEVKINNQIAYLPAYK
ncbi:hypothetical protein Cylst_2567 [Cylindrospermum stagnale PCC 7417]|uniref:Uncharacterized protein n=1 Tax=Cylindrospermum stagnale PCC 7417 TaxID=56107 RepID=K9WX37_9NOST|nr:hypothetical protein [Cylindrospermum stagnale]AFZ24773.1 hypothetical protein Cylst_2567 [Cylindrospermum stagnale PCC 7417]